MAAASSPVLGVVHTPAPFAMPPGACDCHVHVFGPAARYPFAAARVYTPGDASIAELEAHQQALGLSRIVVVHPSPYGSDNRCSVDAVARLGERARGVAVIGPETTDGDLEAMHRAGMRGTRINLETGGERDPGVARRALAETAARVRPLGWHVQIFASLDVIAALGDDIAKAPVPIVVDHVGKAAAGAGPRQPGFPALLGLVRSGNVYVKLSAPDRLSRQAGYGDLDDLGQALVEAAPDRMVWGSDWPHTGLGPHAAVDKEHIEPFRPVDDGLSLAALARWAPDDAVRRGILVDNPARLYGF